MRTKELFNKEVLDANINIIGKVQEIVFDEDTFEITDLVIKKIGFSEQLRDSENVVPVELVKAIGDKVLLKSDDDL
ncbi:PRC-barrel domain-containing protein [Methanobrevibacter millerae]|jgi:sporulation protein YlmC with PRC-barrel domain|uniref:PRC-barrel domain-containing protein n=1 Tax=Methanobrevibacter millerae TaxID=230361 RepID=A0A0U2L6S0_9EURY|nr:PRC-barrel domain-containing protein [Methanobrevibacter millerae]ALT69518.1 PRC-barrel domain-containing protein [Methanobrevibacter millerae]MBO6109955.1 PRC-barrel domain-containing protein [Methanobrevibacter sp.]MBO6274880.1 PRC-barrel domain-containing protein [Methanobrevibacter sp.]MBP3226788.1 PRC-barrel domain-containing protein [Methanobrevibacter sp.]